MARIEKSAEPGEGRASAWRDSWPEPFDRLRRMAREMDMLVGRLMGSGPREAHGNGGSAMHDLWTPRMEITQAGDEMVVRTDLPGTRREDVTVEVQEGRLTIQGERRSWRVRGSEESAEEGIQSSECTYGHFYREVPLPPGAQPDSAHASMRDGVLEVRLRVPGRRQGRRLAIEGAQAEGAQAEGAGELRSATGEGVREGGRGDWHLGR